MEPRVVRDLRLANGMNPDEHFSQTKQIDVLKKGDSFVIADILSSRFQQYDDLGDVFRLLNTLNGGGLDKFEFILGWPDYELERKVELYSEFACHELNIFLLNKDPEFFRDVVLKHLRFKRDTTFIDRWLLQENVDEFADPWKYNRLNIFEQILLSKRLEDRGLDISRNVGERYLLQPTPRAIFGRYFDASLVTASLDFDDDSFRFDSKKALLEAEKRGVNNLSLIVPQSGGRGGAPAAAKPAPNAAFGFQMQDQAGQAIAGGQLQSLGQMQGQVALAQSGRGRASGVRLKSELDDRAKQLRNQLGRDVTRFRREARKRRNADGSESEINVDAPYSEVPSEESAFQSLERLVAKRDGQKSLFLRLGATKEYVENNYWHLPPTEQTVDRVKANRFWRDYASHVEGPFLSTYFAEANRNLTEMMFALAVIDLPFQSPEHQVVYDDATMKLTPAGPVIALHQQVRPAVFDRQNTTILVSENFYQKNDRYRYEDGVQFDKFVSDEFIVNTLYGAQVVITNPTSTPRAIDVLLQIPNGAMIAGGSQETRNIPIDLAGFSTQTFDYYFYFPQPGEFSHFPAHVSKGENVLAVADPVTFKVTDRPAELDKSSWAYVSQNGSEDDVIEFINTGNVLRLDLNKIAFRMKDKSFFNRTIQTLRERFTYNHTLWAYSVLHNDQDALQEFLSHAESFVRKCGIHFESELLRIEPVERQWYHHSEYWPLVNSRSHRVGPKRTILNPEFHQQYHRLMDVLSNRRSLDDDDHLVVTYYMLLQDRIDEAIHHFEKVDVSRLSSRIQFDYCSAYLDMILEKPEDAAAKAEPWADYPVLHWRNRFKEILAQVEEVREGEVQTVDDTNQQQKQTELASKAPSCEFDVESRTIRVNYQNLQELVVNFYEMDIELMFSRKPFAQDELDGFSMIRPNLTQTIKLPAGEAVRSKHEFDLPEDLNNKNVLVEIVAGDQTKAKPYFANSLNLQLIESYGQLKVTESIDGQPLPKAYVKVYSRSGDTVKFHKDGYTDLRGRFDYVSQSNNSIDGVQKYSILVIHPDNGAVIRQALPPQE